MATYKSALGETTAAELRLLELDVYGSQRLGVLSVDQKLTDLPEPGAPIKTMEKGRKHFELVNHPMAIGIGNVLSVISDRLFSTQSTTLGKVARYTADTRAERSRSIVSSSDYYPFGMQMPGRKVDSGKYRFGFQGQEKDDELRGEGNSNTAMYWQYDTRLGRRWNRDPVVKDWESPYVCFADNPVWFGDPNGDDSIVFNNAGEITHWKKSENHSFWLLDDKGGTHRFTTNDVKYDVENLRKNFKVGDKALYFLSDADINMVMYGNDIYVRTFASVFAYNQSKAGKMDFAMNLLYELGFRHLSDKEADKTGYLFYFGTQQEIINSKDYKSSIAYNLMDAGNFLWGQAAYRIGLSFERAEFGANWYDPEDTEADKRAYKSGYYHRVSTWNVSSEFFNHPMFVPTSSDIETIKGVRYFISWMHLNSRNVAPNVTLKYSSVQYRHQKIED